MPHLETPTHFGPLVWFPDDVPLKKKGGGNFQVPNVQFQGYIVTKHLPYKSTILIEGIYTVRRTRPMSILQVFFSFAKLCVLPKW